MKIIIEIEKEIGLVSIKSTTYKHKEVMERVFGMPDNSMKDDPWSLEEAMLYMAT